MKLSKVPLVKNPVKTRGTPQNDLFERNPVPAKKTNGCAWCSEHCGSGVQK